jgi:hypothetical protein
MQRRQELLDAEMAEGIAALKCGDVQGHYGGLGIWLLVALGKCGAKPSGATRWGREILLGQP